MPPDPLLLARESLLAYAIAQYDQYRASWHHRKTAAALEAVAAGEITRLIIQEPPRHGKSMLTSDIFPAWYLGKYPDKQIIFSTYSQDFSDDWGAKVRDRLNSPIHTAVFPNSRLKDDSQSKSKLGLTAGGFYFAVGIGGPTTGRGADIFLIDDPIKNREQADSEIERKALKDWYTSTAYTRLMKGGAIIIIQTRWHSDDLAGWLQREHAHENWTVIDFPALDRETETKALWPEQYPVERLSEIRKTLGPRDWSALYMQQPTSSGGGEFKREWLCHYDKLPMNVVSNSNILTPLMYE